ncbi:MAG: hypothetical protein GMKNLPBB_02816 [Myxococcota bacterium]|nr:hypothetical protein [Myxococcota bacterium]
MNLHQRAAGNLWFRAIAEGLARLASLVLALMTTRILGDAAFGKISFAQGFAAMFAILGDAGANTLLVRQLASNPDGRLAALRQMSGAKFWLIAWSSCLAALVISAWDAGAEERVLAWWMILHMAANLLIEFVIAADSGVENFRSGLRNRTLGRLLMLAGGAAGLLLFRTATHAVAGMAIANTAGALWMARSLQGRFPGLRAPDWFRWPRSWRNITAVAATTMFTLFYLRSDPILLKAMNTPDGIIGQYGMAARLFEGGYAISLIITGALFPILSSLAARGEDITGALRLALKAALLPGVAGAVVMIAGARGWIDLFFGGPWSSAPVFLAWFGVAVPFVFINDVLLFTLVALKRERLASILMIVRVAADILLKTALIPYAGPEAVAACTAITEVVVLAVFWSVLPGGMTKSAAAAQVLPGLLAGAAIAFAGWRLHDAGAVHPLALAFAGLASWALALPIFRIITHEDMLALRYALNRRKSST